MCVDEEPSHETIHEQIYVLARLPMRNYDMHQTVIDNEISEHFWFCVFPASFASQLKQIAALEMYCNLVFTCVLFEVQAQALSECNLAVLLMGVSMKIKHFSTALS